LVHFSLKIRHLVAKILMIFLRVLPKIILWPHYSGAPGARGPRFIEPPEPSVPTPLLIYSVKPQCSNPITTQVIEWASNRSRIVAVTTALGVKFTVRSAATLPVGNRRDANLPHESVRTYHV